MSECLMLLANDNHCLGGLIHLQLQDGNIPSLLSSFTNCNSATKRNISSTIWLPWDTVHISKAE